MAPCAEEREFASPLFRFNEVILPSRMSTSSPARGRRSGNASWSGSGGSGYQRTGSRSGVQAAGVSRTVRVHCNLPIASKTMTIASPASRE